MNLIIFRVDSSNIIGAGHIHRCICLAKALKDRNNRIVFFCRKLKGNLINLIIKNKFKVYINKKIVKDKHMNIWTEKNQEEDYKFIRSKIKKKADMLICDHYGLGISWRKKIKLITKKLFIIDDKDSNNNYCDFYLNHNINVSKKRYDSHSKNKTVFLEGLDYLITGQNLKFRKKKIKKK